MNNPSVAIVRGKFLNRFDMQSYDPLVGNFDLTAFGSLTSLHTGFSFPTVRLMSPMDLPDFPYKMPILNRMLVDAHYLVGLEHKLMGFDLVHTAETYYHYTRQCLEAKRRGFVRKVISTVWETIPHNNEGIYGRREFKTRAIRELDHFIAVTRKAKEALVAEGADDRKITVIGAHVDTKKFHPVSTAAVAGDPKRRKQLTILFCGRLVPEKGIPDILTAMQMLAGNKKLSQYRLHWRFVGNGSLRKDIEAASRLNLKSWHSTIETAKYNNMPEIYQHADIFVAPSKTSVYWEEQYGMALLEAQASGLPIVTTRSGGIPENVGGAAVLIRPGDAVSLSREIFSLITQPEKRRTMGKAARTRALHVHDVAVGAVKLSRLYERVLNS